ncbi:hypothetical protein [Paenibacillus gallinarum]|uniref:Uncharacterized protein n=1 Tax=Paenibacillus gallinarum TaxID=2762232 RepID=A0ABR8SW86_9BACL|nr:hypothetical protein [Paenibacillus gallinarum]MBD7967772.1 hypothetical protein [Paenibacillus gallinarum]
MPEKSGFFDHTEDDPREYPAREWAEYFGTLITNGVLNGGLNLNVSATGTDANVSISTGIAWIKGYRYSIYDSPLVLPIQPATTQDRIDRIILRLDTSITVKRIRALVVQGTPSANPVAPNIVRSGDVFDLSIAQVRVKANSTIILPANITDERLNQSVCGLMNSLIKVDTATFQQQWDAFIASVQNQGFATPSYVNAKALEAETNAKNASLPKTGGTISGALRVNGEFTFADGGTYTSLKQSVGDGKAMLKGTIITEKGGTVSQAGSTPTFVELDNGIRSIQQGRYASQIITRNVGSEETWPIAASQSGVVGPTIATFVGGTKLITASAQSYSSFSSSIYWSARTNTNNSLWIQLCLLDDAGRVWNLMKESYGNEVINEITMYILSLSIDLEEGLSRLILAHGLNENVDGLSRYNSPMPAGFNRNGTTSLRYVITSPLNNINMTMMTRHLNIPFKSM